MPPASACPLLICGAPGTLGAAFADVCIARGIAHVAVRRDLVDLVITGDIAMMLDTLMPWGIVDATGWTRIDAAAADGAACRHVTVTGLAEAPAHRPISCLTISCDVAVVDDDIRTPTVVPSLVDAALDLLIDGAEGVWHLSEDEAPDCANLTRCMVVTWDHDPATIRPVDHGDDLVVIGTHASAELERCQADLLL